MVAEPVNIQVTDRSGPLEVLANALPVDRRTAVHRLGLRLQFGLSKKIGGVLENQVRVARPGESYQF